MIWNRPVLGQLPYGRSNSLCSRGLLAPDVPVDKSVANLVPSVKTAGDGIEYAVGDNLLKGYL